jgi:hypothetical protein
VDRRSALIGLGSIPLLGLAAQEAEAQFQCVNDIRMKWPLNGYYNTARISSEFGANWNNDRDRCKSLPKRHVGFDIADASTYVGAPVYASYGVLVAKSTIRAKA